MAAAILASAGFSWPGLAADPLVILDQPYDGVVPLIVAGDETGDPADSPASRVDPNTTSSIFAGVGSIKVSIGASTYIGTGTVLTPTCILTAAHVLDINGDGLADTAPEAVTFYLNYGGDQTYAIAASVVNIHPAFNGTSSNLNDDVAVIELSTPLPASVPTYDILRTPLQYQTLLTMVGYGWSGYGDTGYTIGPGFTVKRAGTNSMDGVWSFDDEGTGSVFEVWYGDYDYPDGVSTGFVGDVSFGNASETTLGGGDSGGPGFFFVDGQPVIYSINTFTFTGETDAPLFGSGLGGIHVAAYSNWIDSITGVPEPRALGIGVLGLTLLRVIRCRRRRKSRPLG